MHHLLLHPPFSDHLSPCSGFQKQERTSKDGSHITTPLSMFTSLPTDTPHVANVSQEKGIRKCHQVLSVPTVNPSTGAAKKS